MNRHIRKKLWMIKTGLANELDQSVFNIPERKLIAAVLIYGVCEDPTWVQSDSIAPYSFRWICDVLNIDYDYIKNKHEATVKAQEQIWGY